MCVLGGSGLIRPGRVPGVLVSLCLGSRGYLPRAKIDGKFLSSLRFIDQRGWNFPERGINLAAY